MNIKINQIALLIWLLFISVLYYASFSFFELYSGLPSFSFYFKPSFSMIEHAFILALILISANGWAAFIWFNTDLSHLERLLFATATGLGILSFIVFVFSLIGLISSPLYFFVLITGFLLLIISGKQLHSRMHSSFLFFVIMAFIPLSGTLIGALSPPTQFDSLVYHLALPLRYILEGKMSIVPHNIFFSFPQNMEMLYLMGIKLDCDILANLISWSFFPLIALSIHSFSVRFWAKKAAVLAPLIWLFTPAAMFISTGTYVDLGLAFYTFLSIYAYLLWKELKRG